MEIREINENKKEYLELLLLADEQESMIDRYLERGEMYVLYDAGCRSGLSALLPKKMTRSSGIEKPGCETAMPA